MQIIGQKSNLEIINTWESLPQFIIIQGDKHTGKTSMVLYLCEKFGINYVKMKNGIKDVRELIKLMTKNSNTLYHFKDFDKASIQAKNALLKITEEPVVGNYIVITGSTQIKTLESRARKIVMNAYSMQEMSEFMQPYYNNFEIQHKLYIAGINTPSKVVEYSKYDATAELVQYAYNVFNKITYLSKDDILAGVNSFDVKYDEIDACYLFLDMLIHIIENNILEKQIYSYYEILQVLIAAKESIEKEYTLNRKFIIFRVLYTLSTMKGQI